MMTHTVNNPTGAPTYTRSRAFLAGAKDTIPLMVGAFPFGLIYGAIAINAGLSPFATVGMSLFVFAGSAQFIAAGLFAEGVTLGFIVLTTFIVNLRHMLYSASLAPYMKHLSQRWLLPLAFWLTDETYAVVIRNYAKEDAPHKRWYHLGSSVAMYLNWQLCTIIGVIAGTRFEGLSELGLDFALVVTFIGIVIPLIVTRPMFISALVAGIVSLLANDLENKAGLMVAAFAGIAAGMLAEAFLPKAKRRNAQSDDLPGEEG